MKLYFKKIKVCNECPNCEANYYSESFYCILENIKLGWIGDDGRRQIQIPEFCPLLDSEFISIEDMKI